MVEQRYGDVDAVVEKIETDDDQVGNRADGGTRAGPTVGTMA